MYKIPANTLFLGQSLVYMPECHSTNAEAVRLIQNNPGIPEGTVIITNNQTSGRGQRGNTWESEAEKNLTFSLILKPTFILAKDQFKLNMAISLGLFDYMNYQVEAVKIKWPNDIMLDGKKTCGILIENQISGQLIQQSIVGIGLNVNQENFSLPTATSLSLMARHSFILNDVLQSLLQCVEGRYLQLRSGIDLKQAYINSLYGAGLKRKFKSGEDIFDGVISGIDDAGRLETETSMGKRYFDLKEIQFLN